jgi:hypothetical protein
MSVSRRIVSCDTHAVAFLFWGGDFAVTLQHQGQHASASSVCLALTVGHGMAWRELATDRRACALATSLLPTLPEYPCSITTRRNPTRDGLHRGLQNDWGTVCSRIRIVLRTPSRLMDMHQVATACCCWSEPTGHCLACLPKSSPRPGLESSVFRSEAGADGLCLCGQPHPGTGRVMMCDNDLDGQ